MSVLMSFRQVRIARPGSRGFSLIELLVVLTLVGLLTVLGVPGFQSWMARARLRSTAEAMQNALRLAQAEAIRTSRVVGFVRTAALPAFDATPSTSGANWYLRKIKLLSSDESPNAGFLLQASTLATQNSVAISGGPTASEAKMVCFDSFGRQTAVTSTNTGLSTACTVSDDRFFELTTTGTDQKLRVQVFLSGKVRLCIYDTSKKLADGYEQGC
jgi:type IV fimbrial biogenesis protein FimT